MIRRPPRIEHLSAALVRAFAVVLKHPGEWLPAERLARDSGAAPTTIYRRFGNLVAARVLVARRIDDFRHFQLHPDWQQTALGAELRRRAAAAGLV